MAELEEAWRSCCGVHQHEQSKGGEVQEGDGDEEEREGGVRIEVWSAVLQERVKAREKPVVLVV